MPYIDNNGTRIYYQIEGAGTPLLLHHPLTSSHRIWYHNGFVDALKDKYRVLTMDMRGHGKSDRPDRPEEYSWGYRVTDIAAVLDDASVDKVHMVGYSAGGFGGFAMASHAPDRLLSLVIAAAQPYGETYPPRTTYSEGIEGLLEYLEVAAGATLSDKVKAAAVEEELIPIAKMLSQGVPSWEDVLPHIAVPCLMMSGEHDIRYEQMIKCANVIPGATFVPMPGLGHFDAFRHFDKMLPQIKAFLEDVQNAKT